MIEIKVWGEFQGIELKGNVTKKAKLIIIKSVNDRKNKWFLRSD